MDQGHALESLGHSIEYVYDSRVYQNDGELSPSDVEAVQLLMRLSREVFMECREVVPARRGFKLWLLHLWPERRGFLCSSRADGISSAASCRAALLFADFVIAATTGTARPASDTVVLLK
jgi:hypothetical protein